MDRAASASPSGDGRHAFRADIQGLRALAVGLVVAYHLWPHRVTGGFVGVDVFFVISGFLITSHLVGRPPRTGRDLGEFWRRRVRRLLPASLLVLAATAVGSRLVAPSARWADIAKQTIASAAYVQNWVLAGDSVDYLGAEKAPSPLQHFWSLSVEEQFYLVWPVLLLAAFAGAARRRLPGVLGARLAIAAVFTVSLLYSVHATATSPASAYFVTPTRMWELAAGGLVAVFPAGRGAGDARWRSIVAWAGIVGVVLAGLRYTAATPFPGSRALLPVLGTAAVIWAAATAVQSPTRWLGLRPVTFTGDISYSIYLWHWPLIVLVPYWTEHALTLRDKAGVVVLTALLAWASKNLVEDRFRTAPREQPLRVTYVPALAAMVAVIALAASMISDVEERTARAATVTRTLSADHRCFAAAAMAAPSGACPVARTGPLAPTVEAASRDRSAIYQHGCITPEPAFAHTSCRFGSGRVKVALVGNSHAGQWLPAFQALADQHGWTVDTYVASACQPLDDRLRFSTPAAGRACADWGRWVQQRTSGHAYDLVVVAARTSRPLEGLDDDVDPSEGRNLAAVRESFVPYLQRWVARGTRVVVLRDTPYPHNTLRSVPDCLSEHDDDYTACSGSADEWVDPDPLVQAAARVGARAVHVVDLTRFFCRANRCPVAIGRTVVFFDGHHMTATYSRSLAPYLGPALLRWLPAQHRQNSAG